MKGRERMTIPVYTDIVNYCYVQMQNKLHINCSPKQSHVVFIDRTCVGLGLVKHLTFPVDLVWLGQNSIVIMPNLLPYCSTRQSTIVFSEPGV